MSRQTPLALLAATVFALVASFPSPGLASDCVPSEQGGCLPTAPDRERVDLIEPSFSDPTSVTNPLFPISDLQSALLLGSEEGVPLRVEVTLLPETRTVDVNGQSIEVLVSQYVAFVDGRIFEVALDLYAQADDGAVWYFGEDVYNYEDGVIADSEGTWHAGKDGPAAMIMPAEPRVGDVYRPENIPGVVFEEVTVTGAGETVDGPHGPVDGAIVVEELHQDGTYEDKIFAPGYGEFYTGVDGDSEALAVAVPTDALTGPPPAELAALSHAADDVFDAVDAEDWAATSSTVDALTAAWETYRAGGVPPLLESQLSDDLAGLAAAVDDRDPAHSRQAAIDVAYASFDFALRYRPPVEIDLARFDLWVHQLVLDAGIEDPSAVSGDVTTLAWVWDRIAHTADLSTAEQIEDLVTRLRAAAELEDYAAATAVATQLHNLLARSQPAS